MPTSFGASIMLYHPTYQPPTGDRARASRDSKVRGFLKPPTETIAQLPILATRVTDFLNAATQELTTIIIESAKASILISKPGAKAKP